MERGHLALRRKGLDGPILCVLGPLHTDVIVNSFKRLVIMQMKTIPQDDLYRVVLRRARCPRSVKDSLPVFVIINSL